MSCASPLPCAISALPMRPRYQLLVLMKPSSRSIHGRVLGLNGEKGYDVWSLSLPLTDPTQLVHTQLSHLRVLSSAICFLIMPTHLSGRGALGICRHCWEPSVKHAKKNIKGINLGLKLPGVCLLSFWGLFHTSIFRLPVWNAKIGPFLSCRFKAA